MSLPVQIASTDFDGTIHCDLENPPIPREFEATISAFQSRGLVWVINTGRTLAGLITALEEGNFTAQPDYVVTVEREIYRRNAAQYASLDPWNSRAAIAHAELYAGIRPLLSELTQRIHDQFDPTLYEDTYSPFCLIARNEDDADEIYQHLLSFARTVPALAVVRNGTYMRLGHAAFDKGSSLAEIARLLGVKPEKTLAVGDHFNDLPMLTRRVAHLLAAPANAIDEVKHQVRQEQGYVSSQPFGYGTLRALEFFWEKAGKNPGTKPVFDDNQA